MLSCTGFECTALLRKIEAGKERPAATSAAAISAEASSRYLACQPSPNCRSDTTASYVITLSSLLPKSGLNLQFTDLPERLYELQIGLCSDSMHVSRARDPRLTFF
jgi:hypothetical protein